MNRILLLCLLIISSALTAVVAEPANDDFANAKFLDEPSGIVHHRVVGATLDPGDPDHGARDATYS